MTEAFGYSGTARRKGRQQTNRTYCHRATSRLYGSLTVSVGRVHVFGRVGSEVIGGLFNPRFETRRFARLRRPRPRTGGCVGAGAAKLLIFP